MTKKNQIISVGRWESYQKNFPLLVKWLSTFLDENPDWTSLVVGSGLPEKSPHPRISLSPFLAAHELSRQMQSSKLFLSSSRFESFGLAAAEAACCGCLPVGAAENTPLAFFQSFFPKPFHDFDFKTRHGELPKLLEKDWAKDGLVRAGSLLGAQAISSAFLKASQGL